MATKNESNARKAGKTTATASEKENPFEAIKKLTLSGPSVRELAARRCTKYEIALILGTTVETITARFQTDYDAGVAQFKGVLRGAQAAAAADGNVSMQIWLGKNHLGQTESGEKPEAGERSSVTVVIHAPNELPPDPASCPTT